MHRGTWKVLKYCLWKGLERYAKTFALKVPFRFPKLDAAIQNICNLHVSKYKNNNCQKQTIEEAQS